MRPLRARLRGEAARLEVPIDVVERDYALGHILAAAYAKSSLAAAFVFKGGTALKKAYFGDYRFSVDLDFTAIGGPRGDKLMAELEAVADAAQHRMLDYGPFDVTASRQPAQRDHPTGQEEFRVAVKFPWHPSALCSIKLEVTVDEPLMLPARERSLLHGYEEALNATLRCYALEEVVAEKLRTVLQAQRRREEGRWLRDCARDYYDLWRLCVGPMAAEIDFGEVERILPAKCAVRGVGYSSTDDFFPALIVEGAARQWGSSLSNLVRPLPEFATALDDVKRSLRAHFSSH
jgi:predicted nucleotidyltransferase component of viral defense system